MQETTIQKYTWIPGTDTYRLLTAKEQRVAYPEQREDDMGETSIHAKLVGRLMQMLLYFLKDREDVFLSDNLNIYFEAGNPEKWLAPDILVAFDVEAGERSSYKLWEEKVCPQVIFEIASERTWKRDLSDKLEIYTELGVEEYYLLDPRFEFLPAPMLAFRRRDARLLAVEVGNGRVFSERLNLEIVRDENNFRLFDPAANAFLRTLDEAENEVARLQSEIERLRKEN